MVNQGIVTICMCIASYAVGLIQAIITLGKKE